MLLPQLKLAEDQGKGAFQIDKLEGMGMRAIGRVLGIHHKTVSRWLVRASQALPANPLQTEACSFIEIDELCTFIAKKNLNVGSG